MRGSEAFTLPTIQTIMIFCWFSCLSSQKTAKTATLTVSQIRPILCSSRCFHQSSIFALTVHDTDTVSVDQKSVAIATTLFFDRLEQFLLVIDYLCSSRRRTQPLCCHRLRLALQCERRAGSLRSQGEAKSSGNGRCRQPASPEHNCPDRPSTPGTAAPLWPAAPRGTRSGLRLRTETVCLELRSETPHLQNRKQNTRYQGALGFLSSHYFGSLTAKIQKYLVFNDASKC